jgi:alkylation response protein AidB-like acyl-CoA dehydrogenase
MTETLAQPSPATGEAPATGQAGAEYLARAKTVAALIEREAANIEREATITQPVVDALVEQRLFWLLVPEEYGGAGLGMVESLKVIEEISRADGSTGWAVMANAFSVGIAVGFLEEDGARELFDHPVPGITAGMILPTGKAVRADGGYRVTGRYQFASGSAHANWIGAGFVLYDEQGNPVMSESGTPECRVAFLPREEIDFLGNWDVLGMVGTGSYDYAVTDVFVPERHTMDTFSTVPVRPEPVYKLGLLGIGVGGHSAVALGLATRALQEIATITSSKARLGYPTVVADSPMFRREFAKYEALLQAARAYVYGIHAEAEATAAAGEEITAETRSRMRQVTTWVQEVASEVVGFAHRWGGSQSIRNPSALGRCTRDAAVATQHLLVDPMTLVDAAGDILPGYVRTAD